MHYADTFNGSVFEQFFLLEIDDKKIIKERETEFTFDHFA
jgi:hypothetical protein